MFLLHGSIQSIYTPRQPHVPFIFIKANVWSWCKQDCQIKYELISSSHGLVFPFISDFGALKLVMSKRNKYLINGRTLSQKLQWISLLGTNRDSHFMCYSKFAWAANLVFLVPEYKSKLYCLYFLKFYKIPEVVNS